MKKKVSNKKQKDTLLGVGSIEKVAKLPEVIAAVLDNLSGDEILCDTLRDDFSHGHKNYSYETTCFCERCRMAANQIRRNSK